MDKIILFQEKEVRRVWHNSEWYFVINDIIKILTNTPDVKSYWKRLKKQDPELAKGGGELHPPLSVATEGGKQRLNCANTEGVFRIIMSVPSPNAEPFKLWMAQVGRERIEEIENPELSIERAREIYRAKGYSDEWIDYRLKGVTVRKELTDEWKNRGVKEGQEYAILTAEIAKATFGVTPNEHSKIKGLEKENLRDHMTNLELIFAALGEEATRAIAVSEDAQGFNENHGAAVKGGNIAGKARKNLEKTTGKPVVEAANFIKKNPTIQSKEDPSV